MQSRAKTDVRDRSTKTASRSVPLRLGASVGVALLWLVLFGLWLVQADDPLDADRGSQRQPGTSGHAVALSAGEDGPFFTLDDLAVYTPGTSPLYLTQTIVLAAHHQATDACAQPELAEGEIALSAGENGPFFALDDLAVYTPVPRMRPRKWEVKPLFSLEYPPQIKGVPFVARAYPTETITYLADHEILHGDRQRAAMALTFDCEAGTGSTNKILEVLQEHEVKATFFVLGKYAFLFPDIVRKIVEEGHEVGNHSFFHPLFTAITPTVATQELTYTEAAIDWAVGRHVPMRYVRFPYGGRNYAARLLAAELGYQSAFWDIDPRGWDPAYTVTDVVEHISHTAHYGGIVIMHCGSWDDANALSDVIEALEERGITPGTLSDALSAEDYDVPHYPTDRRKTEPGTP
jgi:peptidoglycan/xylan/chitin deacetylase (PgdA/CDA1 family)